MFRRMSQPPVHPHHALRARRGSALILVLVFTVSLAALAMSAIFLSSNATLLGKSYDRERDFKYAAEAALAMGKSRLNNDAAALPDSGWDTLMFNATVPTADSTTVPNVTVNLYAGPTGSTTGQFGRFASLVAEARDNQGSRFVRRLEVTQESFAKFAYWTDNEKTPPPGPVTIYFQSGDNIWGPVWSNDTIHVGSTGAWFHDAVGTAKVIIGKNYGTFSKGYKENDTPINLPSVASLAKLSGYATSGGFNYTAVNKSSNATLAMRIEFVAIDLNGDGDSTDVDEGFFKVYKMAATTNSGFIRADTTWLAKNCGDWHPVAPGGPLKFFPASIHNQAWAKTLWIAGGMTAGNATTEAGLSRDAILLHAGARCYLGGDPHLVAIERAGVTGQKGGDDTTWTTADSYGTWQAYAGVPDARLVGRPDAQYLFPMYRGQNPGAKGVIYVNGNVGVSGVLRGRITLYSKGSVVFLDDMRYATDPSSTTYQCNDVFGVLTDSNSWIADNDFLDPPWISGSYRNMDDTKDFYLHGVVMSLGTSFGSENYSNGSGNTNDCEGTQVGRGCIYLTGGLIQLNRGIVGVGCGGSCSRGWIKRYSYDRCAVINPPPYFPTTGRFTDNRYYEIDPVRFNVATLFTSLTPAP
jgi:Tfp pilus assembly protein PilX